MLSRHSEIEFKDEKLKGIPNDQGNANIFSIEANSPFTVDSRY